MRPTLACVAGPPGAGKTTFITKAVAARTGSVFRLREAFHAFENEIPAETRLASDRLGWLSDDAVQHILHISFTQGQFAFGPYPVFLDNFPGRLRQLHDLRNLALHHRFDLAVLEFVVGDGVLDARVTARRVCPQCHPDLHQPAAVAPGRVQTCALCGSVVVPRKSDHPEVHRLRLSRYRDNLADLGRTARGLGVTHYRIDASRRPDEVHQDALQMLDQI